jgi:hypothetical protein
VGGGLESGEGAGCGASRASAGVWEGPRAGGSANGFAIAERWGVAGKGARRLADRGESNVAIGHGMEF